MSISVRDAPEPLILAFSPLNCRFIDAAPLLSAVRVFVCAEKWLLVASLAFMSSLRALMPIPHLDAPDMVNDASSALIAPMRMREASSPITVRSVHFMSWHLKRATPETVRSNADKSSFSEKKRDVPESFTWRRLGALIFMIRCPAPAPSTFTLRLLWMWSTPFFT